MVGKLRWLAGWGVLLTLLIIFIGIQVLCQTSGNTTLLRTLSISLGMVGIAAFFVGGALALVIIFGALCLVLGLSLIILFPIPLVVWSLTGVNVVKFFLETVPDRIDNKFDGGSIMWLFALPVAPMLIAAGVLIAKVCVRIWV